MGNIEITNYDAVLLEQSRTAIIIEAYKQFPNLKVGIQVYNDSTVGMQDYNQYLAIVNQFPVSITTNHVS